MVLAVDGIIFWPTVVIPLTDSDVRFPTVVILGCDAVCNVPVTVVAETSDAVTEPAVLTLPP